MVQHGAGDLRPLVVCYYIGMQIDAQIRHAVSPNATVLNLTTEMGDGSYMQVSPLNLHLPKLREKYEASMGCKFGPVVMMGWSRGCEALRAQLVASDDARPDDYPDAMIALDGIASSTDPPWWQINEWRKWFVHHCGAEIGPAGLGKPGTKYDKICVATCSQIVPPAWRSVRATLEEITDWELPPGAAPDSLIPWPGVPGYYDSAGLQVWSWPGATAKDHAWHQNFLAPFHLYDVAARLGFQGQPPASPPGPGESPPVVLKTTPPKSGMTAARVAAVSIPAAICGLYLYWSVS